MSLNVKQQASNGYAQLCQFCKLDCVSFQWKMSAPKSWTFLQVYTTSSSLRNVTKAVGNQKAAAVLMKDECLIECQVI